MKKKPIGWFTRGGKHIPIFEDDSPGKLLAHYNNQIQMGKKRLEYLKTKENTNADIKKLKSNITDWEERVAKLRSESDYNTYNKQINANRQIADRLNGVKEPGGTKEKHTPEEIAKRYHDNLAKKNIKTPEEIEKYLGTKSPAYINSLAKDMGIPNSSDRLKAIAQNIAGATNKSKDITITVSTDNKPSVKQAKQTSFNYPEYESILGKKQNVDPVEQLEKCHKYNDINPHYNDVTNRPHSRKEVNNDPYHNNCALCSTAVMFQVHGYDVEALPRDKKWRGLETILDYDYSNPDNFILSNYQEQDWYNGGLKWDRYTNCSVSIKAFEYMRKQVKQNDPTLTNYAQVEKAAFEALNKNGYKFMPKGANQAAKAIEDRVISWGHGSVGELSIHFTTPSSYHSIVVVNNNGRAMLWDAQNNKFTYDLLHYFKNGFSIGHGLHASHTQLVRIDNAKLKDNIGDDLEKMVKKKDRSLKSVFDQIDKDIESGKLKV